MAILAETNGTAVVVKTNGVPAPSKNSKDTATPTNPQLDIEYGVSGILPFASWYDYATDGGATIGNDPAAVPLEKLVEMRKHDGQARALVRLLTLPIRSALKEAEWIEPDGGGEEEAAFANLMWDLPPVMGGMSVPKTKLLKQFLLALNDGFSVFEEVRQVPDDGPLAGKIVLRKLAYRDSRTILFRVDDRGGFAGVRQVAPGVGYPQKMQTDVVIPREKVVYYAANEEENPFYGVSYFEAAYYHYEIKKKLYYIAHVAAQFAAVPGRVGKVPPNPDRLQMESFKRALGQFAFNTSMIHPEGYEVNFTNGNTNFDFLKLIDHHNTMMAASVLAKFMQQEDRQVLIDNGKADASADMFVLAVESIMNEIAEVWTTHLMPKYIDWNFGSKKYPVFKFGALTDTARDAIKELFSSVVAAGTLNCTPEFVRQLEEKLAERLGLDIDYDEIARKEQEQAEAEAAAQAAQEAIAAQTPAPVSADGTGPAAPNPNVPAPKPKPTPTPPPADPDLARAQGTVAASGVQLDLFELANEIVKLQAESVS